MNNPLFIVNSLFRNDFIIIEIMKEDIVLTNKSTKIKNIAQ